MGEKRSSSSIVEVQPIRRLEEHYDAAILGGGLAGLTLAIQLKNARPETSVVVFEKREGLAPLAAFKVGESTVAAGAHYFAKVVGMREHLVEDQLVKCGLRFFLPGTDNTDISLRREKGPFDFPVHDNYQLDRGLFENRLAVDARALGIDVTSGARVGEVSLEDGGHRIELEHFGMPSSTTARWVVDASGRAALLKRKLDLGSDSGHHINAAWFRLRGGLDIEDWGRHNEAWLARMKRPGIRRFSTNHLLGKGYWVWLIPLSSGPISIGVCADPRLHPFDEVNEFGRLLHWLREHEPQLAAAVENRIDDVEDFLRVEDFSYGVKQVYSTDRWALVGEAAAFADPFFSPGSDFIGYGNTFAADLIVRDLGGEDIAERVEYFNRLYQRVFEHIISRYRDTYPIYGNPAIAFPMLNWDFYSTHSGIVLLFVTNKLTDLEFMKSVDDQIDRLFRLNINVHKLFLQWNELQPPESVSADADLAHTGPGGPPPGFGPPGGPGGPPPGIFFGPPGTAPGGPELSLMTRSVRLVDEVVSSLVKDYPDDEAIRAELREHLRNSEDTARDLFRVAARLLPGGAPPDDREINPYAVGLEPERWEADGLFDSTRDAESPDSDLASGTASRLPSSQGS